jgi:hypothetical protein
MVSKTSSLASKYYADEDRRQLYENLFAHGINQYLQSQERKEIAEKISLHSQEYAYDEAPEVMKDREYWCKLACILYPNGKGHDKKYQERWIRELSLQPEEDRQALIDGVEEIAQEQLPKNSPEFKTRLYVDLIGKREALGLARSKANERQLKKKKEEFAENMLTDGQNIFDLVADIMDKIPEMDEATRDEEGVRIMNQLNHYPPEGHEATSVATLHLSAAYLAHNNKACFTSAQNYINNNVTMYDLPIVIETIDGLRLGAKETSLFHQMSDPYAKTLFKRTGSTKNQTKVVPTPPQ